MTDSNKTISDETWDALYEAALEVRVRAHAPYSGFKVGAALLTESGEIFVGCNIENASLGATSCAERTAIGTAVASGQTHPQAICVVTRLDKPAAPCGICRQVLSEFADNLPVLIANATGERVYTSLDELLPFRFGAADLDG